MEPGAESRKALTEAPPSATSVNVEPLLRPLIRQLRGETDAQVMPAADDVLLDVEMDGVRCLLINQGPAMSPTSLSPREREIAGMVSRGYPNKAIAAALGISSWTVSTHLRRVFAKLGVSSRAAMVARLAEDGLLSRPQGK